MAEAKNAAALARARSLSSGATALGNGVKMLVARLDGVDAKAMQARFSCKHT